MLVISRLERRSVKRRSTRTKKSWRSVRQSRTLWQANATRRVAEQWAKITRKGEVSQRKSLRSDRSQSGESTKPILLQEKRLSSLHCFDILACTAPISPLFKHLQPDQCCQDKCMDWSERDSRSASTLRDRTMGSNRSSKFNSCQKRKDNSIARQGQLAEGKGVSWTPQIQTQKSER